MSALGSSVINKSGKKFAPKAPARRPAAPASTLVSARPSVDRQVQSHTPQPQHAPNSVAASPTPSAPLLTSSSHQQPAPAPPARNNREGDAVTIPAPSRRTPASETGAEQTGSIPPSSSLEQASELTRTSPTHVVPQKRPLNPPQVPDPSANSDDVQPNHIAKFAQPSAGSSGPNLLYSDFVFTTNRSNTLREDNVSSIRGQFTASSTPVPRAVSERALVPAVKRRRVDEPEAEPHETRSSVSKADANVPLPSTENDQASNGRMHEGEPASAMPQTSKAMKPRLSTEAKRVQRIEREAAAIVEDATRSPSAKVQRSRKNMKGKGIQKVGGEASGAAVGASSETTATSKKEVAPAKPQRRKKTAQTIQDAAAEVVEEAVQKLTKDGTKRGRRGRQRAVTPEGAEAVVIIPSEVKMSDLCKDNRTGRKSERGKDLAEFDRAEFVRKKQKQLQEVMGHAEPSDEPGLSESANAPTDQLERLARQREREASVAENVPNTIIVNGQIQIDEDSLHIDRHAAAEAARVDENIESVDENNFTHTVNSFSWLKRDKSGGWNALLTERFYEGLRMFGTDFEMIRKMFPGRTRHKIKLKFVKEEKFNYDKIKATLLGESLPVDLQEYEMMAGVEFGDPKELERDMEDDRKRLEEETRAEKEEMETARRERDEQIATERAAAGEESSAQGSQKGKSKRKKGEKHSTKRGSSKKKDKNSAQASSHVSDVRREAVDFE